MEITCIPIVTNVHRTLCTVYSVHCILYNELYKMYSVQCILYTVSDKYTGVIVLIMTLSGPGKYDSLEAFV